jgi:hypothetical protein
MTSVLAKIDRIAPAENALVALRHDGQRADMPPCKPALEPIRRPDRAPAPE